MFRRLLTQSKRKVCSDRFQRRKLKRKGPIYWPAGRWAPIVPYVQQEMATDFRWTPCYGLDLAGYFRQGPGNGQRHASAYVNTYLREKSVRKVWCALGAFSRFWYAASQNSELWVFGYGRECGTSSHTIKSYYEILEDTMIAFPLQAWSKATKKNVAHPDIIFWPRRRQCTQSDVKRWPGP